MFSLEVMEMEGLTLALERVIGMDLIGPIQCQGQQPYGCFGECTSSEMATISKTQLLLEALLIVPFSASQGLDTVAKPIRILLQNQTSGKSKNVLGIFKEAKSVSRK